MLDVQWPLTTHRDVLLVLRPVPASGGKAYFGLAME